MFRVIASDSGSVRAVHLHTFGDIPCDALALRRGHLTPGRNLQLLRTLHSQGYNLQSVCDSIADARAGAGVQPSTAHTYDSHLRQINTVCTLLGEVPLPEPSKLFAGSRQYWATW